MHLHGLFGVRGTGSAGPQEMLIFWVLLIFRIINVGLKFLVTRKRLTYHAAITDGIACRPLNYGVWNACETLCVNIRLHLPTKDVEETYVVLNRPQTPAVCSRHEVWRDKR